MSLAVIHAEHRRLAILRVLSRSPNYSCNDSILDDAMDVLGVQGSRAQILADLSWLESVSCVTLEPLNTLTVATATQHGLDAAKGDAIIPGIKRPSPKERA